MIIHQSRHESGYSDFCSTTTTHFYPDLNVVVTIIKYDGGKVIVNAVGGTEEQQNQAKERVDLTKI